MKNVKKPSLRSYLTFLAKTIDVSQKGNDSQFPKDISKYPISQSKLTANADFIISAIRS